MNNDPQAVIAIKEEHVIIRGVEMTKETAIVATEQGLVSLIAFIYCALQRLFGACYRRSSLIFNLVEKYCFSL